MNLSPGDLSSTDKCKEKLNWDILQLGGDVEKERNEKKIEKELSKIFLLGGGEEGRMGKKNSKLKQETIEELIRDTYCE